MPGKPYQSKLIPHTEFIRNERKKRTPYIRLAELLKEKFGVECTYNAVFSFVKARRRIRKPVITMAEAKGVEQKTLPSFDPTEVDKVIEYQKAHSKPVFTDEELNENDNPNADKWAIVRERANTDHSKRLVIRKNQTQEDSNEQQ